MILDSSQFREYINYFNALDEEDPPGHILNRDAWAFLESNIPLFETSAKNFEKIWYFRWWTFRKHIYHTPEGYVITEFLPPVPWAGKYNTISCALGHHFNEGRWLHNTQILQDYASFWLNNGNHLRVYSNCIAKSLYDLYCVTLDKTRLPIFLPHLIANYFKWERGKGFRKNRIGLHHCGLFYQEDGKDGMEFSIGGHGYRATINSYMYADALAIAKIAQIIGFPNEKIIQTFQKKAKNLKLAIENMLWDDTAAFFKVLKIDKEKLEDARELHGYTPWYCDLIEPDSKYNQAWQWLTNPEKFSSLWGFTTAERDHPQFALNYSGHECQWNGPIWPFATSITLTALAKYLQTLTHQTNNQPMISINHYYYFLERYVNSHQITKPSGDITPWIDENLHPDTGDWIARTRLSTWKNGTWDPAKGGKERGKDYNHSTFNDLIITGLLGIRPSIEATLEICPLISKELSETTWRYFCLDNLKYHKHNVCLLWDFSGEHYHLGKGFHIFIDNIEKAQYPSLKKCEIVLND